MKIKYTDKYGVEKKLSCKMTDAIPTIDNDELFFPTESSPTIAYNSNANSIFFKILNNGSYEYKGNFGGIWYLKSSYGSYTESDIGTEAQITLIDGTTYDIVLIGVNHDDLADGSGKAHTTRQFKNLYNTDYQMNSTSTNEGGGVIVI